MDNKILFSKYRKNADLKGAKTYRTARVISKTEAFGTPLLKLNIFSIRAVKLLLLVLVAAAAGFGLYFGADKITSSPDFEIKEVKVSGNKYISKNEILALAKVETGKNMFKIDLREVQEKLKANSRFKKVAVNRIFPGVVELVVEEREPVACIGENKFYQADAAGVVFPAIKSFFHGKRLYAFTGINVNLSEVGKPTTLLTLKQALAMVKKIESRGGPYLNDVMTVDVPCSEELALVVQNTRQVYKIGEGNWDEKIDKLLCLLKNLNERKKDIASVDLRFRDEAVVQFKNSRVN